MTIRRLNSIVADEEACCPYGHIRLCKARGESVREMAKNAKFSFWTMRFHVRRYNTGVTVCQGYSDCMKAQIEEVESLVKIDQANKKDLD